MTLILIKFPYNSIRTKKKDFLIGIIPFTDDPSVKPATDVPVNECEEFCCMFSATINGQKILYGAEMDGIDCNQLVNLNSVDLNRCNFVELKVKLREQNQRQSQNYLRFKLRNWWCQCFLVNIQKVIVGTRNQNGIVKEITTMAVKDFPKQCQVSKRRMNFS